MVRARFCAHDTVYIFHHADARQGIDIRPAHKVKMPLLPIIDQLSARERHHVIRRVVTRYDRDILRFLRHFSDNVIHVQLTHPPQHFVAFGVRLHFLAFKISVVLYYGGVVQLPAPQDGDDFKIFEQIVFVQRVPQFAEHCELMVNIDIVSRATNGGEGALKHGRGVLFQPRPKVLDNDYIGVFARTFAAKRVKISFFGETQLPCRVGYGRI